MFLAIRRNLLVMLACGCSFVPAAASAATVEFMSVRIVQTQKPGGDTIKLAWASDGGADTVIQSTVSKGQPLFLNRVVGYKTSVRVRIMVMNGATSTLVGNNVLTTKAGIYESTFQSGGAHYVLVYRVTPTPPPPTYVLQINWIFAVKTQESGGDEILFRFSADGGKTTTLSRTMRTKDVWNVRKDIPFRTKATISLHDEDVVFDDALGSMTVLPTHVGIAWTTKVFRSSDGTNYTVSYRVVQK